MNGGCSADPAGRTFGFDFLPCPRCGGRLRMVAVTEQSAVIERILQHLDLPADVRVPRVRRQFVCRGARSQLHLEFTWTAVWALVGNFIADRLL